MTLHDIPNKRLEDVVNTIYPHYGPRVVFAQYTKEGMDTIEVTVEQVKTELAVRYWRSH